jgi:hypothetical protein
MTSHDFMITFQCYSCQQVLRVPDDKKGKKAKCPKCGTALTIPVASGAPEAKPRPAAPQRPTTPTTPMPQPPPAAIPAVPMAEYVTAPARKRRPAPPPPLPVVQAEYIAEDDEDELDEEPVQPKKPASAKARWRWVRIGLLIVFISTCVLAAAFAIKVIGYLLWSIQIISERPSLGSDTFLILLRIGEIAAVCATLAVIVGYIFCAIGPNKHGSMGLAIATASVSFIYLLFASIFLLPVLFRGGLGFGFDGFGAWLMLLLTNLFFAAEIIIFPLYLSAVARARKQDWLSDSSMQLVWFAGTYAAERLIIWILIYVLTRTGIRGEAASKAWTWILLILLWVGIGNLVYFLVRHIMLLWQTRETV